MRYKKTAIASANFFSNEIKGEKMTNHEQMWEDLGMDVELHKELLRSIDKTFKQTIGA